MAHSASVGSVKKTVNVPGKRLGVKKFGGEYVKPGNIILRQRGSQFYAGKNTKIGRDFTIFSLTEGFVSFRRMTGYKRNKNFVDVVETAEKVAPVMVKKEETVEETKTVAKKPAARATKPRAKKTSK